MSGRVLDPQGAVIPGAQVVARQTETNVAAEAVTDRDGRFRFPYLKVGPYVIAVHLDGFKDFSRQLTLTVGSAFDLPIQLALAGLDASVTVTAEPALIETARSQIAGTVSQTEVQSVPLNGRNFLDLALLVPGVSPTNTSSTQLFSETSAVPGGGLSVGSQRNFSNNFIVDGLSANDDAAGLSGMPYGVDAVDQFQVVTSGGQAELGRALGGYINVVTKSGTNSTRGDVYEYLRDDAFNAANALTRTTLPMRQNQYGVSLGGPLVRNRTFYFANVEQRKLDQVGLTTIAAANASAINARLAAVGYPGSPLATGTFSNPVDTNNVLAKVDHQVRGSDQLTVRYSQYDASSTNSRGAGALSSPTASAALDNVDRTLAAGNTVSLSPRTVNETRAQVTVSDLQAPPSDPVGPAVTIAGVATFGTLSTSPTRRQNTLYEIVDNLSHQAGAHALRAGIDFLYNDDTITFPRSVRGAYTFSSLANFLAGSYNNAGFTQTFGATRIAQTNPNLGVYAQDEWKAGPSMTLNAGVRYDLQMLQTIRTDRNNVSPRFGATWSPFASKRTIVRGSAGLFYDRVPLRALANALLSAGNTTDLSNLRQTSVSLSPGQAAAPAFPAILGSAVPSVTLPNLTTMDRSMQNAYSQQAAIEIEQQIGARSTVSVGYQYTRGVNLIISLNQNVPSCVAAGTNNGCRPISAYGNNTQYSPRAASSYHGFHVSFVERPTRWGYYRVSYTVSKAMDDVGEFFFSSPIDPFDIRKDWGRSDDDQRHRLVLNGAINSPMDPARTAWERLTYGFQVSGMLQYYSSLPLNITSGLTTVQGTTARPVVDGAFIARNSGTGPDFFSLSLRVSRRVRVGDRLRLEGIAEGFNLTNRVNVVTLNGNFGPGTYPSSPASSFGQITAVGDPRSAQFAVRLSF
ncbi:MAG TPA: carboxypeptidase regulatory-like domain-containing protein [Vicinamibacterales bacterium]|nr:carboxypeptidase regulatory-like domain-containing protein [Vicinamibacterales bacterium]